MVSIRVPWFVAKIFAPSNSDTLWNRTRKSNLNFPVSTDTIDLGIQYMEVPGGKLYSDNYGSLSLVLKVDIGGSYILDPNPTSEQQNYGVSLFLSKDEELSPSLDLPVILIFITKHRSWPCQWFFFNETGDSTGTLTGTNLIPNYSCTGTAEVVVWKRPLIIMQADFSWSQSLFRSSSVYINHKDVRYCSNLVVLFFQLLWQIQPKWLFQLYDVPINFAAVGTKMTSSGSIYLGGPDLKLPRLHSDLTLQQYCGLAYLGVWVDNGDGIFSSFVLIFLDFSTLYVEERF